MKNLFLLFITLITSISLYSQISSKQGITNLDQISTKRNTLETPPPLNLKVDKLGYVSWDEPDVNINFPMWMRYDNGVNIQGLGTIGGGNIEPAIKWDPIQLVGYNGAVIKKIKLYLRNLQDSELTVRVYHGEQGDILYEQIVENPIAHSWNTIELDEDVVINSDEAIWVGYKITHYSNQYPAGAAAPVENPNSDYVKNNDGAWKHLKPYLNYSWNLAAYVEGPDGKLVKLPRQDLWEEDSFNTIEEDALEVSNEASFIKDPDLNDKSFVHYKLYLDGVFFGNSEFKYWQLSGLIPGEIYNIGVSAMYDEGESDIVTQDFAYMPPPQNLIVTAEGVADWDMPAMKSKQIYFSEDFNSGNLDGWEIMNNGNSDSTWQVVDQLNEASFDGSSFAIVNSDAAATTSVMDEMLISPVIDATGMNNLILQWDQNYNSWDGHDIFYVKVFDGEDWVSVFVQTIDDPSWPEYVTNIVDVSQYYNDDFRVAFHYVNDEWAWWAAIDNVMVYEGPDVEYNVLLDDEFVAVTNLSDYKYQNLQDGQTYISGVAAKYSSGISDTVEYEFIYDSDYYYVGIAPPSKEVSYLEGEVSFNITSNDSWQASTEEDWIQVSGSYGEGDGYLRLNYDQNHNETRTGTIKVIGINGEDEVEVTLIQGGIHDFLPPRNLRVSTYGLAVWDAPDGDLSDLIGYTVYLDGATYNSTQDLYRQFLSLIPNQTYTAGVQAIYANQDVSAIIETEFTYTSIEDLLVSPEFITVDENVGSTTFNVFSNTDWNISSDADWITISPLNGSFDELVTVFYLANDAEQRTAEIVISGGNIDDQKVFLTQEGTTTLETVISITPANQDLEHNEDFSTKVEISEVLDLADFEFEILFNSSILNLKESNITDFITSSGRQISAEINTIDNEFGILEISVSTDGEGVEGVTGNGDLLELEWEIVSNENNEISTGILLRDVLMRNTQGGAINHLSNDAAVVIAPNAISEFESKKLIIYPNPTPGYCKIVSAGFKGILNMEVYNSFGKRVFIRSIEKNQSGYIEENFENLSAGIYLVRLFDDKNEVTSKLIIE